MNPLEELTQRITSLSKTVTLYGLSVLLVIILIRGSISIAKYVRKKKGSGVKSGSWNSCRGVVFGSDQSRIIYSPEKNEGHSLVIGGSGLGKTSSILIPTLMHWDGPFLAIDISGDISANVDRPDKIVFDPTDPYTIPYNVFWPIDRVTGNKAAQIQAIRKLAFQLMPDQQNADGNSSFFTREGRKMLTAALIMFYFQGYDFPEICRKIVGTSVFSLLKQIRASKNEDAIFFSNSFEGTNEANTAGCKQAMDSVLTDFATDPALQNCLRRPGDDEMSFTPDKLEEHGVFIYVPDDLLDVLAPVIYLVTSQCLSYLSRRSLSAKQSIFLALDEFTSLAKFGNIIGALQKLRKRKVRIMILTQSLADLDRIYSVPERKSMLGNFKHLIILGERDPDSQEAIAKMIGKKLEKVRSITTSSGAISCTDKMEKTWAIEPTELSKLDDLILIHPRGYKRLEKAFFYNRAPVKRKK